ncbi:GntR family transcriptional regulator [Proteus vulgaris]|uniref:GntR family transcriptional regulator n=1 Tax=Proteus TaxID=583 RepID=UPI001413736D|nr:MULTISPECIES: GntR family transcriptional regulator [Proteus]NBM54379.1 GntR family transcriptional regulator [Proteus sp. G2669]UDN36489.1 GntR family transcriptional regulator [Proteus sp. NMG38-2]UPK81544.1 GntR family transcriptional regulator [Proteus vulgaris]
MQKKTSPQILSQKVANIIRQKITIGELPPGERLSETALSETLEISRNTLREVFRVLTQEGLLTYKPNRGVFVSVPDMASIMDIYRVRRLIECDALRHSYPMHPAIIRMQDSVDQAKKFQEQQDWSGVGTCNMHFHTAIAELSDSPRLFKQYQLILAELRLAFGLLNDPQLLHAPYIEKNEQILMLLMDGKAQEAAMAMEDYLEISERTVLAAFSRHNFC